jgi:hypothetical protein
MPLYHISGRRGPATNVKDAGCAQPDFWTISARRDGFVGRLRAADASGTANDMYIYIYTWAHRAWFCRAGDGAAARRGMCGCM